MRAAMGGIATWIFLPSFALTLIAGLLAMAANRLPRRRLGLGEAAVGCAGFRVGFAAIQGPMQQEAELSARALAHEVDPSTLAASLDPEWKSLWVMLAIATANVILGIWRPRLTRIPD